MINSVAIAAMLFAQAGAAGSPCMTREGARDAVMVLAPHLVEALAERCKEELPAGSFLATRSGELVARMRAESSGREASAGRAVATLLGEKMPPLKNNETLVAFAGEIAGSAIASELKPGSCSEVNTLVEALAPLSTENLGRAVTSVLILATANKKEGGPPICPNG